MTRITRSLAAAAAAAGLVALAGVPVASAADAVEPTLCVGVIENAVVGDVSVPYNEACTLRNVVVTGSVTAELDSLALTVSGAVVIGDVVADSRRVDVRQAVVGGDLVVREASEGAALTGSSVVGDAQVVNVQQELAIGDAGRASSGNFFGGDVVVTGVYGAGAIGSNVVAGALRVTRASAPTTIRRNVVRGDLDCSGNRVVPVGGQNVAGAKLGQCAAL